MSLAGAAPSPASATANINQAPAQSPAQTPAQGALASATQNTTDPMAFAQSYMGTAADPEGIAYGGLMPSGQLNGYDDNGNAVTRNASNDATTIGMTPEQLDAYWAAKGANVLTPNLTPTGQLGPTGGATYDPAAVEKNRQELAAIAPNDPDVARQLNATNSTFTPALSATDPGYQNFVTQQGIAGAASTPGGAAYGASHNADGSLKPGSGGPGDTITNPDGTTSVAGGGASLAPSSASTGLGSPTPMASAALQSGASQTAGSGSATPNAGVGLTPTNPDQSLLGQTITPNNSVDRVKTFQDALNSTIQNVLDPAEQARMRDLNRYSFGNGRGVSGMARTSEGDVASDYGRQIKDLAAQGLAGATTGSIDDMYRNLGIAQQQQGFQQQQLNDAFNQSAQSLGLQDSLTNSAFERALQQENAGYANDPSNIDLILSQIFGNQASQAGNAAAGLFGQMGNKAGQQSANGSASPYAGIDEETLLNMLGLNPNGSQSIPNLNLPPMPGVQTIGG